MILLIQADEQEYAIEPDNGETLTFAEMRELLECQTLEFVYNGDLVMVVDEDAKLLNKPRGWKVNAKYQTTMKRFIDGVAGNAIFCKRSDIKWN